MIEIYEVEWSGPFEGDGYWGVVGGRKKIILVTTNRNRLEEVLGVADGGKVKIAERFVHMERSYPLVQESVRSYLLKNNVDKIADSGFGIFD